MIQNCKRFSTSPLQIRADTGTESEPEYILEGYFSVFGSPYQIFDDCVEYVEPTAFDGALDGDIRALVDHNTNLVLGRTSAGTLELSTDKKGLFGRVHINPKDTDAMNLYERVKRGDVSQCSFGFDILDEEQIQRKDGGVEFHIKSVKLYEVSVCTFPAYEETTVSARRKDVEAYRAKRKAAWKEQLLKRLRGE